MRTKFTFTKAMLPILAIEGLFNTIDAKNDDKPNILVFIVDDAGMDFGCYGNKGIKTPNIDRLAASGVSFQNAFLTSPQSSPSRTSMMTGMFAHTIGTEDLHDPIDEKTRMMPSYFKEAGYLTGSLLKRHWGPHGDRQFDRLLKGQYKGDLTEETFDNFRDFIQESGERPFFLWVGFHDSHRGYDRKTCPQVNAPADVTVPPYLVDSEATRRDLADYYDEVSRMDGDIGRMLEILKDQKKYENTIIVFLSDNGCPFPRCKGSLYDSGIQTPLIFVWNKHFPAGSKHTNGLVSTIDLAATLLHFAGVEMDKEVYSKSFHELLYDPSKRGRDYIFAERNWHDTDEYIRCVRSEHLKLIYNAYYELPHGTAMDLSTSPSWYELKKAQREGTITPEQMQIFTAPRPMAEIYDITKDPNELDNVADRQEYLNKGKKLAGQLVQWQKKTKDHPWWKRRRPDQNDRITGFPVLPRDTMWVK